MTILCASLFEKFALTSRQAIKTVKKKDRNLTENFNVQIKDTHDEWKSLWTMKIIMNL